MKKILLLMVCLVISISSAWAQTKTVQGVVVDETNEPVIGANVTVVGTSIGTATDLDGKFELTVPQSVTHLQLKYLGMQDLTVPITSGVMQIQMTLAENQLEEVVISVAYGTQKRNALTGAVTSLGSKQIEQRPVTSVTALLEGKLGIMTQTTDANPDSEPSVRIRGFGSVNGSNSPLYVVDGFVFEGQISDINAQDIAEISVLKDASSAALYGNRAANGVIIITTKRGNTEKPHISLTMNQGFDQRAFPDYERLKADQWMEAIWMGYRNSFISAQGNTPEAASAAANANLIPTYLKYNIYDKPDDQLFDANGQLTAQIRPGFRDDLDWFEAGTKDGHRSEYILSGDGRIGGKSDYYFSAGYLDQQGYLPRAKMKRFSGRAKININPVKWFRTGFNLAATDQTKSGAATAGGNTGFTALRTMPPIYPVHLHDMQTGEYILDDSGNKQYDGSGSRPYKSGMHSIWENELNMDNTSRKTITGNLYTEITFPYDFKAKVSGNMDSWVNQNEGYANGIIGEFAPDGQASITDNRYKTYTFLEQLTWSKTFKELYHVDVLAAHENYSYNYVYANIKKVKKKDLGPAPYLSNFMEVSGNPSGYETNRRTESYLGRMQFNYDEKYYLDASFRRDGSSRFYIDNRWGNFYSLGAAWTISKEAFMDNVKDKVNYLKLRANYGETGNDASVGTYGWMALYDITQNALSDALVKSQLEALDIRWEAATSFGLALDGRAFDRLSFSLEYFDKRSRDLLFDVSLPLSAGSTSSSSKSPKVTKNIGSVANRGFELSLNTDIVRTKNFTWHVELDATALKNKILVLPEENREKGIVTGDRKYTEGHGMYDFWVYQYAGVDMMSGRALYELNTEEYYVADPGGAPAPADEARTVVPAEWTVHINGKDYVYKTTYAKRDFSGSPIPKVMGAFSTGIVYKGLALDVLFSYGIGNKVMDNSYASLMNMSASVPEALHKDILQSWNGVPAGMTETSPNRIDRDATPILDPTYSTDVNAGSTRWLINGSYLMFKNINLSWSLPKQWIQGLELTNVRLNLTAENIHLFSARKGLNSQMSFDGQISDQATAPRVISMGIKVDF
jgi:TonB-linked SusC/RagA family outer membrane protein